MIVLVALIVLVLAAARLTRLLTIDVISTKMRASIDHRFGPESSIPYLFFCYWCMGIHVSALLTAATLTAAVLADQVVWWHAAAASPILTLAVSYGASWLIDKEVTDGSTS